MSHAIGADLVIYQKLEDLIESCRQFNRKIDTFDCSVFTGEYVTGGVDEEYFQYLEALRSDNAKIKSKGFPSEFESSMQMGCSGPMNGSDSIIGLPNNSPAESSLPDSGVGLTNSFHGKLE